MAALFLPTVLQRYLRPFLILAPSPPLPPIRRTPVPRTRARSVTTPPPPPPPVFGNFSGPFSRPAPLKNSAEFREAYVRVIKTPGSCARLRRSRRCRPLLRARSLPPNGQFLASSDGREERKSILSYVGRDSRGYATHVTSCKLRCHAATLLGMLLRAKRV